ncbi:MAG: radical SAM protein [Myxococcota bacterium]
MRPDHEDPAIHALMSASPADQLAWLRFRGYPPAVLLALTNACAQRCFFCAGPGTTHVERVTSDTEIRAHLGGRPDGVDRLLVGGNEPTLHPSFEWILRSARTLGYTRVELMTNGATLRRHAARWASLGLAEVVVPLYGTNAAEHDAVAGVPCFDAVVAGLDEAYAAGVRVRVHTLFLRRTLHALGHLAGFVRQRYGERLAVGLPRSKPVWDWRAEAPTFEEIRASLPDVALLVAPLCLRWGAGDGPIPGAGEPDEAALLARLYFASQARVYPAACGGCPSRERCPGVVAAYA